MKIIITGCPGQDSYYLAKLLLSKGYEVIGLARKVTNRLWGIEGFEEDIDKRVKQIPCDINNFGQVCSIIAKEKPDEIYHLAAQSFVATSFKDPFETIQTNIVGTLNILESIKQFSPNTKMYFAGSSEQFGNVVETPQKETTPFNPRSPYGVTKIAGFGLCKNYRESYGLFICNGICFNHESERRGLEFVTKKISKSVARIKLGLQKEFNLGNLDAKRDWGYAGDYVEAMWLMLQQDKADDYVVATGENHSIREFVELAFQCVDMKVIWEGEGLDEVAKYNGEVVLRINKDYYRPTEVELLLGDYSKLHNETGWIPKTKFKELVKLMVEHDLKNENK